MFPKKYCAKCGLRSQDLKHCGLTGQSITADDFCSNFQEHPQTCAFCNRIIISGAIYDSDSNKIICENCLSAFGTCRLCANNSVCMFETDPFSTPKLVQQEIRRGPSTLVRTVKNPKRIEEICEKKGCKCYNSNEKSCNKDLGTCFNYS